MVSAVVLAIAVAACGSDETLPHEPPPSLATASSGAAGGTGVGGAGGAAGACSITEAPAELETATGTLEGTLTVPSGCGSVPVALLHAGSGPTDRDGNTAGGGGAQTDCLKLVAGGLAEAGIASLRYDKRGVAASAAAAPQKIEDLVFETYVDDAAAWADLLAKDPRFDGVVLMGHSEGSLIGMLAAEQTKSVHSFVSLEGPGRPAGDVLKEQLGKQIGATLLDEANQIIDSLEAGMLVPDLPADFPPALQQLFAPSLQPYLVSWFKYDPAAEVAKLGVPVQIVQGTTDIQVDVLDAQLLAAADPDAELVVLDGMNHVLKAATLAAASQNAAYTDPSLPLAEGLVDALSAFAKP